MRTLIESPFKEIEQDSYDVRSAKPSSYSYLLPAEAGVANSYRAIMLAIARQSGDS